MSRLYLICAICDRRQANGLLSGAAWGRFELPQGASVEHAAVKGTTVLSCPACVNGDARWQEAALVAIGVAPKASDAA
ncbi:MAG TPA: hypothetical protein VEW90_04245 [Gaiellaceae bacterium]|nr:hypothetical protein [Gaiellaceae bacterium]